MTANHKEMLTARSSLCDVTHIALSLVKGLRVIAKIEIISGVFVLFWQLSLYLKNKIKIIMNTNNVHTVNVYDILLNIKLFVNKKSNSIMSFCITFRISLYWRKGIRTPVLVCLRYKRS